jgi:hypothetical protein
VLGPAHGRNGLAARVASAHAHGHGHRTRAGAVAWPGRLTSGMQGDKVHVRASSRGGLAAGHGNGAGYSPLGRRDGEGGGVGRGGVFTSGETFR